MNQSEQINELATALATAQEEMEFAKKDSANPFFKSSYADLASVWEVCRLVLPKNGLAVIQTMAPAEAGRIGVRTTLAHKSGQWIAGELVLAPVKADPQAVGSAITYARRYSLAAIVGVIADDDDGNAASGRNGTTTAPARPAPRQEVPKADPNAATEGQVKLIFATLKDGGIKDKPTILATVSAILGRKITSSKELTKADATAVIDGLKANDSWKMEAA